MKFIIVVLLISCAGSSLHPVNHEIIDEIKSKATWTPMKPEDNPFAFMPIEQIKAMMGTKLKVIEETADDLGFEADESFDSRIKWGSKVHSIRNQGQGGSCWAFGATEALSDRFAIETSLDVVLSPQHLVSGDSGNFGGGGGYLDKAWEFMVKTGVMTDAGFPYTSGATGQNGPGKKTCVDGSTPMLYHAKNYQMTSERGIAKQHIQSKGPVEAAFIVYADFINYKSGIYKYTTGRMLGGHAIKAIGWGVEKGTQYWIMANSWGTSWGENGFFKIAMGDCAIDSQMTFGEAAEDPTMLAE